MNRLMKATKSSNSRVQTVRCSRKQIFFVAIATSLIASTSFAENRIVTFNASGQTGHSSPATNDTLVTNNYSPAPEDHSWCYSLAIDMLNNGDCLSAPNIAFCLKGEFLEAGNTLCAQLL